MSDPTAPPPPPQYTPPPPQYTPPPPPPVAPGGVSPNRQIMIVLSYLWLLTLVPLLVEKDDREVQWHAKNGLCLLVAEIAVWIAWGIIHFGLLMVHLGCVGCALSFIPFAIWLGFLILRIMCIVRGVNGQRLIIPGVSQYADKF